MSTKRGDILEDESYFMLVDTNFTEVVKFMQNFG